MSAPGAAATRAALAEAHAEAIRTGAALHVERFELAGLGIELRFAGPELVPALHRALAHHPRLPAADGPATRPVLTIHAWDAGATGTATVAYPGDALDGGTTAAGRTLDRPDLRYRYQPDGRTLTLLDHTTQEAWYLAADHRELPWWEHAAPMRHLLAWWLAEHGRWLVHGAAVGTPSGATLLMARGGSGKSTTALACLDGHDGDGDPGRRERLRFLGDDYCIATLDPPVVHSLYATAKLRPDAGAVAPDLLATALAPPGSTVAGAGNGPPSEPDAPSHKVVVFVGEARPDALLETAPLVAVLIPEITGGTGTATVARSPGSALAAAGPSTILQLPGAGAAALAAMRALVVSVPCATLLLGTDRDGVVDGITAELCRHRPKVSVLVPVHQGERLVRRALESIAADGYRPVEVCVVDDGSTDASADIVEAVARDWEGQPGLTLRFVRQPNRGVAAARNAALELATGELIAFLDQDDRFVPGRLEEQLGTLRRRPDLGAVLGRQELVLEPPLTELPTWVHTDPIFGDEGGVLPLSMMTRRTVLDQVGPFDTELTGADDLDLWVRIHGAGFPFLVLDRVVLRRGIHDANASHGGGISQGPLKAVRKLIEARRAATGSAPVGAPPP